MLVIERQALGYAMGQAVKSQASHLGGTGFDSLSVPVGFEMDKVALEQGFLEFLGVLVPLSFYQFSIVIFMLLSERLAGEIRETSNKAVLFLKSGV
jgi:hypothetical protein